MYHRLFLLSNRAGPPGIFKLKYFKVSSGVVHKSEHIVLLAICAVLATLLQAPEPWLSSSAGHFLSQNHIAQTIMHELVLMNDHFEVDGNDLHYHGCSEVSNYYIAFSSF
jgi:hypothetical protein